MRVSPWCAVRMQRDAAQDRKERNAEAADDRLRERGESPKALRMERLLGCQKRANISIIFHQPSDMRAVGGYAYHSAATSTHVRQVQDGGAPLQQPAERNDKSN